MSYEMNIIAMPIFQMKKFKLRDIKNWTKIIQ